MNLTKKQQEIYDYIKKFMQENQYPPTIREIGSGVGLSSSATVQTHLINLEKAGVITRNASKNRSLELTDKNLIHESELLTQQITDEVTEEVTKKLTEEFFKKATNIITVPRLGRVTAGNPIEAIETPDEFLDLPAHMVKSNEVFTLDVVGESMINVGIFDGDIVVVEKTTNVRNGDIVVAMTADFEVTLKTYYKEAGYFRLQPENDYMEPIILDEVTILGKATGLYRNF